MANVKRTTAALIGMAATSSVVPIAMAPNPAAANHNGCQPGATCFWQLGGGWGGQFFTTTPRLTPPFPAHRGYNHGREGFRSCAYKEVGYVNLEFSIPVGQYRERSGGNTVVSS
jgi:hypothetical protein